MDFNDNPEEAAFRDQVRGFLNDNAERKGAGRPTLRLGGMTAEDVKRCKAWQAKKAEAGFAGITWQKRFGGRELSPIFQVIYHQEEEDFTVPRGLFEIGLGMCIPTMMAYAKPEQLDRYVQSGAAWGGGLVPVVQRTGRRIGSRGVAHAGGARW